MGKVNAIIYYANYDIGISGCNLPGFGNIYINVCNNFFQRTIIFIAPLFNKFRVVKRSGACAGLLCDKIFNNTFLSNTVYRFCSQYPLYGSVFCSYSRRVGILINKYIVP
jgi:hypothetical protein